MYVGQSGLPLQIENLIYSDYEIEMLNNIRENPYVENILVYADWLEENGRKHEDFIIRSVIKYIKHLQNDYMQYIFNFIGEELNTKSLLNDFIYSTKNDHQRDYYLTNYILRLFFNQLNLKEERKEKIFNKFCALGIDNINLIKTLEQVHNLNDLDVGVRLNLYGERVNQYSKKDLFISIKDALKDANYNYNYLNSLININLIKELKYVTRLYNIFISDSYVAFSRSYDFLNCEVNNKLYQIEVLRDMFYDGYGNYTQEYLNQIADWVDENYIQ